MRVDSQEWNRKAGGRVHIVNKILNRLWLQLRRCHQENSIYAIDTHDLIKEKPWEVWYELCGIYNNKTKHFWFKNNREIFFRIRLTPRVKYLGKNNDNLIKEYNRETRLNKLLC